MAKNKPVKPTAAALRAANEMFNHQNLFEHDDDDGIVSFDRVEIAALIDKETRLPQLIEGLSGIVQDYEEIAEQEYSGTKKGKEMKKDIAAILKILAGLKD